ncbi:MAG: cytochrome c biogenesis protein CcdA, partial [Candidatus Korobacteraceae bacterium]
VGPILSPIFGFAMEQSTVWRGVFLLAVYSMGLAVPFLLTSLGVDRFLAFYGRFRRHLHTVEVCSGILLIAIGVLIFMNNLTWLSSHLTFLNRFAL